MPNAESPVRMTITDLQDQTEVTVQFNPNELTRRIGVNYARKQVLGQSHQPHEYLSTGNQTIRFDLFHNAENPTQWEEVDQAAKFLESLCYAPEDPEGISQAAPPRVLLVWPYTLSLVTRLISVEFKHQRWDRFGNTTQFTASCEFEEALVRRLNKTDVYNFGPFRGAESQGGE